MSYWLPEGALLAECREDALRSSGPGGQHVNKTASAVRLVHLPTGIVVQCQDHRERLRNRQTALKTLRVHLAVHVRGQAQAAWLERHRRGRQLVLGPQAQEFHLVVGCVCDALANAHGDVAEAAGALAISTSQLVKFVTAYKCVHQAANRLRATYDRGPILAR